MCSGMPQCVCACEGYLTVRWGLRRGVEGKGAVAKHTRNTPGKKKISTYINSILTVKFELFLQTT